MSVPITTVSETQAALRAHELSQPKSAESVAAILGRCRTSLIEDGLARTRRTPELNHLHLSDAERTGHLPKLVNDLVVRLGKNKVPTQDSDAAVSFAAIAHGKLRHKQGYNAGMLIHESRMGAVFVISDSS